MATAAQIIADLRRHKTIFDPVKVGDDVCDIIAEEILVCMDAETDADGKEWEPLSKAYGAWKQRNHPGKPVSVLEGHMKTLEQLKGSRIIAGSDSNEMHMTYGVDDVARELATWFQEGDDTDGGSLPGITSQGRPPRPFYSIPPAAVARINTLLDDEHRKKL